MDGDATSRILSGTANLKPLPFQVEQARGQFPILQRKFNGHDLIYLDSAASAQKPRAVISAMTEAMESSYANVHRGIHTLSNEATDAYEKARGGLADLINAAPEEVIFTKGATESINLVAASLGLSLEAGDEVVLSVMEHHANIIPWHFLRERKGVVLRFAPINEDGSLDMEGLEALLGPKTKVVALSHMSNVTGTVTDAKAIVALAHGVGAKVLLDGSQAIVHQRVDVKALGCDFYVFSGHKLYGPTGIGVLYGRAEALAELPPYQGGGEMISKVSLDAISYADPPHRFEAGTPPILEAIGFGAAVQWLTAQDRTAISRHEHQLYQRAVEGLAGQNWLRILGQAPGKGSILSFTMDGVHAHDAAQILDRYGIAVRAGTHCAEPLMTRFAVTSSVRASFALYNTQEEVDAFVDALLKTRRFFV